jgi:hypothetical protein
MNPSSKPQFLIIDIETAPDPVKAFANAPDFDPSEVKTGNIKDPLKKQEKIDEAEAEHWQGVVDKACLDVSLSHIRAAAVALVTDGELGKIELAAHGDILPEDTPEWRKFYKDDDSQAVFMRSHDQIRQEAFNHFSMHSNEASLLEWLAEQIREAQITNTKIVGHCVKTFDIPVIFRRSWACGVRPPRTEFSDGSEGFSGVVDTADVWKVFKYGKGMEFISLKTMMKTLGIPPKIGDGKWFHNTWLTDPAEAARYLAGDIQAVYDCGKKMFIF